MKACVVDDDSTSRVLLGDYLQDEGWKVVTFVHPDKPSEVGTSLVEELSDKETRLLIMDIRFGRDADGLEKGLNTVKKLAKEGKLKSECAVLFVSQFGRDRIQIDSVYESLEERGIDFNWLDKPVDTVFLNDIINTISKPGD